MLAAIEVLWYIDSWKLGITFHDINTNDIINDASKIEEECTDAIETCVISQKTKLSYIACVDGVYWFPMWLLLFLLGVSTLHRGHYG